MRHVACSARWGGRQLVNVVKFLERIDSALELADRAGELGPIGVGVLAWQALPKETRERMLGDLCEDCGEPRSLCECCARCGFTPCACAERFGGDVFTVEGESLD